MRGSQSEESWPKGGGAQTGCFREMMKAAGLASPSIRWRSSTTLSAESNRICFVHPSFMWCHSVIFWHFLIISILMTFCCVRLLSLSGWTDNRLSRTISPSMILIGYCVIIDPPELYKCQSNSFYLLTSPAFVIFSLYLILLWASTLMKNQFHNPVSFKYISGFFSFIQF